MIGLDTNVLVRFLVLDDAQQTERARSLLEKSIAEGVKLYVSKVVLCELVWVLDRGYRFPRRRIISVLQDLLRAENLVFEDRDQVRSALDSFHEGGADFADYMILTHCLAAGCERLFSFDGKLATDPRVVQP